MQYLSKNHNKVECYLNSKNFQAIEANRPHDNDNGLYKPNVKHGLTSSK